MKICPNCGYKQDADNKFCIKCGHSMQNVAEAMNTEHVAQNTQQVNSQLAGANGITVKPNLSSRLTKTNKKKYLLISIVVIIIVALFGFYTYRTSAAHNPDNPLSNQEITFTMRKIANTDPGDDSSDDDGEHLALVLSRKSMANIYLNIWLLMVKHENNKAFNYINGHPEFKRLTYKMFVTGGDYNNISEKMNHEGEIVFKMMGMKTYKKIFSDLDRWGDTATKPAEDIVSVQITPNYGEEAKNGQKVQISLAGKTSILRKYGINLKPRKVKIIGLKN